MFSEAEKPRAEVRSFDQRYQLLWPSSEPYTGQVAAERASGKPLLEVRSVSLSFGGLKALDNVTFNVKPEEILGIVGPNGAGKTSLLNVISGFYRPDSGKVIFKGVDITSSPPHERAKLGIARTFQHSELFKSMTVLENIMIGLEAWRSYSLLSAALWLQNARRWEEHARERAEIVIDLVELHEYRYSIVGSLPPGVQKRVDLARALVQNPELILMDEPMAGLSREEKEDLARVIVEVHETTPVTFILVEHDLEAVIDLCDRVIVMDYGRIIAEGPPYEVVRDPRVIEAYTGG